MDRLSCCEAPEYSSDRDPELEISLCALVPVSSLYAFAWVKGPSSLPLRRFMVKICTSLVVIRGLILLIY